ncbi:amino acid adenylation domain-containing protein [Bacillus sp. WMMC1349]|uniref:non-ribosomal peptide synthetase n=1 Tax=Bacillus sp. WMMC1349 TaxID=2736254 RepID=UPI0015566578|nr:amino acid adenylation domain-containing protein [Bacillus sp. WMMC1349]NPC94147.1 amino acid adenylation domain-containing protein [Bacillus sp. WMMC1349]
MKTQQSKASDQIITNCEQEFWKKYLSDFEGKTSLPCDYPAYLVTSPDFKHFSFQIKGEFPEYFFHFLDSEKIKYEDFIYSAWALLLQNYNNVDDTMFGISNSKGGFSPLRILNKHKHVLDFLKDTQENISLRKKFENTPINLIKRFTECNDEQPIFDSIVKYSYQVVDENNISLVLNMENGEILNFTMMYNAKLFKEDTVYRMSEHFKRVIEQMVYTPLKKVTEIEILTEKEKELILYGFNNKTVNYDQHLTVDQFFENQVEKTPNAVAIICGDRKITYKVLNEKANQLARILRNKGVRPEQFVGLIVERDIELIIGMLGVLKAGGCYIPVDPAFPKERIHYMFKNADVKVLLTKSDLDVEIDKIKEYIYLDDEFNYTEDTSNLKKLHNVNNLMYCLYTSGSTGQPKGVAVEHRNVAGYIHAFNHEFKVTSNDKMIQQSTVSFDISVEEIYPILSFGGTLIIARKHEVENIPLLLEVMNQHGATMISGFPLLLNELNKYPVVKTLRTAISGGDVLREEYVDKLIQHVKIYNTYGPSETTCCISYYEFVNKCDFNIPVGKTIANYKVYILDKDKRPLPIGAPGEVCIGGVGVSREYLNRSDITRERYVENPFVPHETMFISGDLAKWLPDGNIEFLGRIDDQVKIRGRRTEPAEIQRLLMKHKNVKEAFVLARTDKYNHKYLTAYVVGDELLSAKDLKEHLNHYLPHFMIPSYFVQLDKLPLTANGKIDKQALAYVID